MPTRHHEPGPASPTTRVVVDGVGVEAVVDLAVVDDVLLPALRGVAAGARPGRRSFVFLVAPPGAGKSTLAAVVRQRARETDLDLDVVGLDGFHHPQDHLETHHLDTPDGPVPLSTVKGAPETFDVGALARQLEAARTADVVWPAYDRVRHDVVPGRDPVTARLVILEGTWLLLDEPVWSGLADHADLVVLVEADPADLRERLVSRKVRGGLSREAAERFYEHSDRHNVDRVLTTSDRSAVDLHLTLTADGTITRKATA